MSCRRVFELNFHDDVLVTRQSLVAFATDFCNYLCSFRLHPYLAFSHKYVDGTARQGIFNETFKSECGNAKSLVNCLTVTPASHSFQPPFRALSSPQSNTLTSADLR